MNIINRVVGPAAYKRTNWEYYLPINRATVLFANKRKNTFTLNHKGKRKPVYGVTKKGIPLSPLIGQMKTRKKKHHTTAGYEKRRHYTSDASKAARQRLLNRVSNYLAARNISGQAANNKYKNITLSQLIFWVKHQNFGNGSPYVKHRKQWVHYGGNVPVSKRNVLNNINMWRG